MNWWKAAWGEAGRGARRNFSAVAPGLGRRNRGDWENLEPLGAPRPAGLLVGRWLGKTRAPSPWVSAARSRASACASAFLPDPGVPHAGGPGRSALRSHGPTQDPRSLTCRSRYSTPVCIRRKPSSPAGP